VLRFGFHFSSLNEIVVEPLGDFIYFKTGGNVQLTNGIALNEFRDKIFDCPPITSDYVSSVY
jgi:hypothetical protein